MSGPLQEEGAWWQGLAIAGCWTPLLAPQACATCLRPGHGSAPAVEPLVDEQGVCWSALESNDPAMGLPW